MSDQPTVTIIRRATTLIRRVATVLTVLLAITLTTISPAAGQDNADKTSDQVVIFVIDLSGSMNEPFDGSRTKLDVAKDAFVEAFNKVADSAQVGIRVYGDQFAAQPPADRGRNCLEDSRLLVPIGALERDALIAEVQNFGATGDTPIGLALREASNDIPAGARGTIVLFSDGRDECFDADLDGEATTGPSYGEDPCLVAAEVATAASGLQVERIETVGFGADAEAELELRCIADTTGGSYTAIETPEDAREILPDLISIISSARDAERLGGEAITGSSALDGAPDLKRLDAAEGGDGRYTDSIAMNSEKWYRIPAYGPGDGTFTATVFGLPAQKGITLESRLYLPEDDRWTFQERNESAGVPRRPTASVRCPGCRLAEGQHEAYWVVSLESDNKDLAGDFYMELLTEGRAFGGLSISCEEPQECWYTGQLTQQTIILDELSAEYESRLAGDIDPTLTAEREQLLAELSAAQAEASDRTALRTDLESQVAQMGGETQSWTLPIILSIAGLAAAAGGFVIGRKRSPDLLAASPPAAAQPEPDGQVETTARPLPKVEHPAALAARPDNREAGR